MHTRRGPSPPTTPPPSQGPKETALGNGARIELAGGVSLPAVAAHFASVGLLPLALGVRALGANPRKPLKQGSGYRDVPLQFADVRWVPGSYELPQAARHAAIVRVIVPALDREWHPDAVIAVGCVIRGGTEHFRLVADAAAQGLLRVALDTGVPVTNGVLAVEDVAQAEARSGGEHGNAGSQAALAAVRMVNLFAFRGNA